MATKKKSLFIRFNELPENGRSFIYDENNIICGARDGVSVYDAVKVDGKYTPVLPPQASRETREEFFKYTIYNTSETYKKMYLVSGDLVARDERHCPIITNVEIINELDFDVEFPDRRPNINDNPDPVVNNDSATETVETEETDEIENDSEKINRIDEFVDNINETAQQVIDNAKETINMTSSAIIDFVNDVKESEFMAAGKKTLDDVKNKVVNTASNTANKAINTLENTVAVAEKAKRAKKFANAFIKASSVFFNTVRSANKKEKKQ